MSRYTEVTQEITRSVGKFRKEIPDTLKGFNIMQEAADTDGVLDRKTKELLAIAIAIALRCEGCIGFHARAAVKLGITRAEFMEMVQVAVYMGGGPSLMTAAEALIAYEEFGGEAA